MVNWRYAFPGVAALGLIGAAYFGVEDLLESHNADNAAAIGNYAVAYTQERNATGDAELAWLLGSIGTAAAAYPLGRYHSEQNV